MSEPTVRLEGVTKKFGEFVAVRDIDLDIAQGEFFTMLGPSGCGKTTTLRMVAGFEQPTAGNVKIEGTDVAGLPPHKRPTNTVFQSYALFPHMTVADNVRYGLKRRRVDSGEIKRRVEAELERVGLAAEANRRPAQLSGGQQQRVALARALVNLPKVLLLDEPLGALDLKLRKGLQVELKRIQRDVRAGPLLGRSRARRAGRRPDPPRVDHAQHDAAPPRHDGRGGPAPRVLRPRPARDRPAGLRHRGPQPQHRVPGLAPRRPGEAGRGRAGERAPARPALRRDLRAGVA